MPVHRFQVGCPCCGPVCDCTCTWEAPRADLTLTIDYGNTSCGITRRTVPLKDQGGICPSYSTVGAAYFPDFGAGYVVYGPPYRQVNSIQYHRFSLYCTGPYYWLAWSWGTAPNDTNVVLTFRKVPDRCSPFVMALGLGDLYSCFGNCRRGTIEGDYEPLHWQTTGPGPIGTACAARWPFNSLTEYSPDPYNFRAISIA